MPVDAMTKVLIVEDDEVIGRGMASHLALAGFDPLLVEQGEKSGSPGSATSAPTRACST